MVVCEKCSTTRLGRLTNPICTSQVLTHFLRMVKSMACASSTGLMESFGTRKNVTAVNCAGRENFGTGGFRKTTQHLTFRCRYKNGQLKWYAHYAEGSQVHGECKWWHSNGQVLLH